ncbi:MAG: carboxypeptidase regulatory-like domain-containing protein [Flavobacteriales bacterium]|nr:carboxypeptidase regulatory-like domain-containing protein [Flavobacteriales bacterium]
MIKSFRLILLFTFTFTGLVYGQKLYDPKYFGNYMLLYKLTPGQVEFLANHPEKIDSAFLYTQLVGKISKDSIIPLRRYQEEDYLIKPFCNREKYQRLQNRFNVWDINMNGYFLEVNVNSLFTVKYRLIENPLFTSSVINIGYETFVFVQDTSGLPIYDAGVTLDKQQCSFDSSIGGYKISNKYINGLLRIEKNGVFTVKNLSGHQTKTVNQKPPKDKFRYEKINYRGYLISNKPAYKPWDTLFFKSFLVNHKGKPIKERMTVYLTQNNNVYKQKLSLKPGKYRGAYNGYFVLEDSLILDRDLTLSIQNRKKILVKSLLVRYQNYDLKDLELNVTAGKQLVTPGEGIKIYVKATNANGLPVMDGKITLKLTLQNLNYADSDSLVISYDKFQDWFHTIVQTDPSGLTVIEIPDSVFIPLDGQFLASISLLTSDNETRSKGVYFMYQTTRDRQIAELNENTLKVERLYNMKSVRRKMNVKIYSKNDLIADSAIYTPLKLYLPPNVYMAKIFKGDTLTGTFYRQTQLPEVWGKRSHDSVSINFSSKFDIPVFYRIYANNELVYKGMGVSLSYKRKDKSSKSYHLQYGILEGEVLNPRFYSKSFYLAEKALDVQILQPSIVYPGQEVPIEIQVKNAYGKPAKKVNLAAYAVNNQMPGIVRPDIPYMGLVKPQKPLPILKYPLYDIRSNYNSALCKWQLSAFYLTENEKFKLVYPKAGYTVMYDTTPFKTTEVEFMGYGKGARINIVYIKKGESLLYTDLGTPKPKVIRMKPGVYSIRLRTFDRIYELNNLEVKAGFKNFISINTDSLQAYNQGDSMPAGMYSEEEQKMLMQHILVFRYDRYLSDTLIFKVNDSLVYGLINGGAINQHLNGVTLKTDLYNPGRKMRNQNSAQVFYLFGPVNPGDEVELFYKHNFAHLLKFNPGSTESMTKTDQVSENHPDWPNYARFFQRNYIGNILFNTFWWDPYYTPPKDTTRKYVPEQKYSRPQQQYQLKEYAYKNYSPERSNNKRFSQLHIYVPNHYQPKRIWLINNSDSVYSYLENRNTFNNRYNEVGLIARRSLLTYSPSSQTDVYTLLVEINDSEWIVKPMKLIQNTNLFINIKANEFRKLSRREHLLYDRLVKNLTKDPYTQWLDTPSVNKGLFIVPLTHPGNGLSIEGTVIGPNIKYPVANAFVVLERDGYFVKGAISNAEGRFFMDNLLPGKYMLKIKGDKYHYWLHYEVTLREGVYYLLQAQLVPYANLKYNNIVYSEADNTMSVGTNSFMGGRSDYIESNSYAPANIRLSNADVMTMESVTISSNRKSLKSKEILKLPQRSIDGLDGRGKFKKDEQNKELVNYDKNSYQWKFGDGEVPMTDEMKREEEERMKKMASDENAGRTRQNFRDYAYWIPNLYTNRNGMTGFTVRYPDNNTSWVTYVPAMGKKRYSGLGESLVKSYKPLTASLAVPLFLTEGDELDAYGRVVNYTGKTQTGNFFLRNGQTEKKNSIEVKDYYNDNFLVKATEFGDTLKISTGFEISTGYRDAELRKLPVKSATVITGKSMFTEVNKDTGYIFKALETDIGMDIVVYNKKLALVQELLTDIEKYEAFDNYNLAIYLKALLIKKEVSKILGLDFTQDREIKKTVGQLSKSSQGNWFSCFKGGKYSFFVSSYVAEVMYDAHQMGFKNNLWLNMSKAMEGQLRTVSRHESLEYIHFLVKIGKVATTQKYIDQIKPDNIDRSELLVYWDILQMTGKRIPVGELNEMLEVTPEGNLKVSGTWNWKMAPITDDAANTYKAWQLLSRLNLYPERRKALVDFLSTECVSTPNNLIKAALAMVGESQNDSDLTRDYKPRVTLNEEDIPPAQLPVRVHLKPGEEMKFDHKGSKVFLAANRKFRTYNPETDETQFNIELKTDQKNSFSVKVGEPFEIKVDVFAKRNQYNAIIDIPIPAACSYGLKLQNESSYEKHREYQTDRVLIYCDELPFGHHTFTVKLVPKFSGTFYTGPARAALMFYPDKAAFTPKRKWEFR